MPMHNGWLPREGFTSDVVLKIIGKTALNPFLVLPLLLLARFTKKGEDLSILHPLAFSRVKTLFYFGLARWLSNWYSRGVLNNWVDDKYDWDKEVVVVTGGAGGIGGHIVQFLAEKNIKVVVLDIQPLTYTATPTVHYYKCDITSTTQLAAVAKQIREEVGDPTVLINNAGVARGKNLLDATEKDVRFTFDVNTLSHYWTVKEFLPSMVKNNHGMVVTVTSYAAWITVADMVDYAATKAAAYAFHEGLTAELTTRFGAPRVRTVVVNQGFTKTKLFTGYRADSRFLLPALEPESVAEAVVRQVLSGRSGQIILPSFGSTLASLAAMPHWYQNRVRAKNEGLMTNFRGRQVVEDLDSFYAEKEKEKEKEKEAGAIGQMEPEESTVLVSEEK